MPLRALRSDSSSALAVDYSADQWAKLKQELRAGRYPWSLPCCSAPAIAKTSRQGLQFFAHKAGASNCASSGETEHHRALKTAAIHAARAAGWVAETEVPGTAPNGESWIADVLATRGAAKVAVEIQWSRITEADLLARQERYARSGVRGLWLVRGNRLPTLQELPAAHVRLDEGARYVTSLPEVDSWLDASEEPELTAAQFLEAAFVGRLRWGFREGEPASCRVMGATQACWKCSGPTTLVTAIQINLSGTRVELDLEAFGRSRTLIDVLIPVEVRQVHGIGALKKRYSRTRGEAYLSNGCRHCDALQGSFFQHEATGSERELHSTLATIDDQWLAVLSDEVESGWRVLRRTDPPSPTPNTRDQGHE